MSQYSQTDLTKPWQVRLRLALQQWIACDHDEDALLQGTLLTVAANHFDELGEAEQAFIQASLDFQQRQTDETEAQGQHELAMARQTNRRLRRFSLILAGVTVVAIIALIFAIRQSTLAQARQLAANAQLAFSEGNTHLAVLLALEAQNLDPTTSERLLNQTIPTQARHAPGQLIGEHQSPVLSVAWHPDGTHLASASFDQTVIIWNTDTWQPETVLRGHSGSVLSVAWHPAGTHLVSTSFDRTAIIWNTATWQRETTAQGAWGCNLECGLAP